MTSPRGPQGSAGVGAPIQAMRVLALAIGTMPVVLGVVALVVAGGDGLEGDLPVLPLALGAALVGAGAQLGQRAAERPLDCSTEATLVGGFRARLLLRLMTAEMGALLAFVAVFLTGSAVAYVPGAVVALAGIARAVPTAGRIVAEDEALRPAGCTTSLVAALHGPGGPVPPSGPLT